MASRALSKGTPMSTLAEELGVTAGSLRKYVQKARDEETSPSVDFVPVSVSPPPAGALISVVSPSAGGSMWPMSRLRLSYCGPCLRRGFNGLIGLVESRLRMDAVGGDVFLFINRRRTLAKVLLADG